MIISREHFAMIFHHFQKIIESMGLCPEYKKKKEKIELMLNSFRNTYSVLYKCRVKFIISKATICLRDLQRSNIFVKLPLKTVHENFTLFLFEQKCTEYERVGVHWIPQDPLWKRQTFIYYNMKVISNSRNKQLPDERLNPYTRWCCTRTLASLALI